MEPPVANYTRFLQDYNPYQQIDAYQPSQLQLITTNILLSISIISYSGSWPVIEF